jgi:hypothetical protein
VGSHICSEYLQRATNQVHGTIGVPTCPATADFAQSAIEPWHEAGSHLAPGELGQVFGNRGKPEDAWPALSGTLVGQESGDARRLGNPARFGSEHNDDPDAG